MPAASHPQAQFVPIPPDLDLRTLVENTANFDFVTRLPKDMLKEHSPQSLENLILLHVIVGGKPLVIEGWETRLDPSLYNPTWLRENLGTKAETVRDIPNASNIPMSIGHYLKSLDQLTKQFTKDNYRDPKRQRLYLKDIDTPEEWHEHLQSFLPECLFYLNECIETRTGGNGAILEPNEYGQMRYGRGVAPAGDLMSSLPEEMRAQNMMCYIGHEGTYTPAHREMCGSLGHNIMVETSHDQRGEKAGSSIWFMTETKEREVVSEYFLSMLGHDIEVEKHFAQINAWKKAPFNVYVVEQKVGDLILIPPLAPHQVWNRGTRTMKAAWNRTTVDTLELAIHEALPRARLVCRDEQYKNKAIIYYTLQKYFRLMQQDTIEPKMWRFGRIKEVMKDFKRLFALYSEVLISESFSPALPKEKEVEFLPYDSNVTCSYCRCNIFNRFLTCKSCIEYGQAGAEDTYDICMECYAMGRSCGCISGLKWVEQWQWTELIDNYEDWRNLVIDFDDYFDDETSPQPFNLARERYGKKPVAQIVQEQLTIRPWHDIRAVREPTPIPSDAETDVGDEGRPKKKAKRKSKKVNKKTHTCHVCMHHEWNWKLAFCTTCSKAYCYGVLFRAFDLMPQAVMENEKWQCPECLGICSCGKCRRGKKQKPYAPKGTLLGHDTRAVADFRSVESLVDFSRANLQWLRGEGDENPQKSSRMERLKEKAQERKSKEFAEGASLRDMAMDDDADISAIDPSLLQNGTSYMMGHGYDEQDADAHGTKGYEPLPHDLHHVLEVLGSDGYQHNSQDVQPESDLSRQAAPVAQMLAPDISYPDPSNFGRDRMMGIGYYQQADNIDKILYDSPGGSEKSASQPAAFDPSLLDPSLAVADTESAAAAKRKRADLEDLENSEDVMDPLNATLFKRQRRHEENDNDFQPSKSKKARLDNRPVRKSAAKIQSFAAYDEEEAILGDVDPENGTNIAQPNLNHNDLELAEQAMMRLYAASADEKPKPKPKKKDKIEEPKRRSTRGQLSSFDNTPVASAEKPGRKSAWLARKEVAEAEADQSVNGQPKKKDGRGRPRRSVQSKTTEPLSESEEDDEDGRISLSTELPKKGGRGRPRKSTVPTQISSESEGEDNGIGGAMISDNDSLFNEPTVSKAPGKRGLKWRTSDVDINFEVPQMDGSDDAVEEPTLIYSAKSNPVPPGKRLSLREKMALKGKGFKIVRSKERPSIEPQSAASSSRNTPSATNLMQEKSPVVSVPSPAISTTKPATPSVQSAAHKSSPIVAAESASKGTTPLPRSRPETPATTTKLVVANGPTIIRRSELVDPTITRQEDPRSNNFQPVNKPKPSIEKAAEPVIKKGPTVVRLMESESESESDPDDEPMSSTSDESSSGESIPAVKSTPKGSHGNTFVRGRGSLSVRGSRGRGRGRPRGS